MGGEGRIFETNFIHTLHDGFLWLLKRFAVFCKILWLFNVAFTFLSSLKLNISSEFLVFIFTIKRYENPNSLVAVFAALPHGAMCIV